METQHRGQIRIGDWKMVSGEREVVAGDRKEVVGGLLAAGSVSAGEGGCSWAIVVRRNAGTRSAVTPPPQSDLAAAAEIRLAV